MPKGTNEGRNPSRSASKAGDKPTTRESYFLEIGAAFSESEAETIVSTLEDGPIKMENVDVRHRSEVGR